LALKSNLFKGSRGLAACEINDAAHFTIGKGGDDVGRIQMALFAIDSLKIDRQELLSKTYGQSTASAVLAFKAKRKIINYAYQNKPDNIVGKMTIAALDREMSIWEATHRLPGDCTPAVRAARTGFHPQINFALSSSAVTAPQPQINKHTLRIYCSITKKASVENGYPLGRAVERARDCLSNYGMFLSLELSNIGVRFADTIDFVDDQMFMDDQVVLLRQASETLRPGFPGILRVIACRMGHNNNFGETYRNRSIGGVTFPPFVFLNTQNVSLDVETLIHEMIHAALPAARAKEHDPEDSSVFFRSGRTEQGATSHSALKPERAAALSNAFFAI
jgi:hypothetical protein